MENIECTLKESHYEKMWYTLKDIITYNEIYGLDDPISFIVDVMYDMEKQTQLGNNDFNIPKIEEHMIK